MIKTKIIMEFYDKNKQALQDTAFQSFLSNVENRSLLETFLISNSEVHKKNLDDAFKKFLLKIKLVKYINNLIHFYTIDFDKRNTLRNKRFGLFLDAPIKSENNSEASSLKDIHPTSSCLENEYYNNINSFEDHIEDESLYNIYLQLTNKQKRILEMIYVRGMTSKEIADLYGESPQNISNIHRRAIRKIQVNLNAKK